MHIAQGTIPALTYDIKTGQKLSSLVTGSKDQQIKLKAVTANSVISPRNDGRVKFSMHVPEQKSQAVFPKSVHTSGLSSELKSKVIDAVAVHEKSYPKTVKDKKNNNLISSVKIKPNSKGPTEKNDYLTPLMKYMADAQKHQIIKKKHSAKRAPGTKT